MQPPGDRAPSTPREPEHDRPAAPPPDGSPEAESVELGRAPIGDEAAGAETDAGLDEGTAEGRPQAAEPGEPAPGEPAPDAGPTDAPGGEAPGGERAGAGRRRTTVAIAIAAAVAVVATSLLVFLRVGPGEVALALDLSPGQAYRYHVSMAMDSVMELEGQQQPVQFDAEMDVAWRVVSVGDDGVATVELRTSNSSAIVGGEATPLPESVQRMRIAPDGRILSGGDLTLGAGSATGGTIPGGTQWAPLLPTGPVEPGDAWSRSFDQANPFGEGTIRFDSRSRFVGYEDMGGARAAVLETQMSGPIDLVIDITRLIAAAGTTPEQAGLPPGSRPSVTYEGNVRTSMRGWVDPEAGELLRSSMTQRLDVVMGFEGFPESEIPAGTTPRLVGDVRLDLQAR